MGRECISAIVATIGRPESLVRLLDSLAIQSRKPDEVIVADGSGAEGVQNVTNQAKWAGYGLCVRRVVCQPPNAVRQREAAIAESRGHHLLFLDDDVVLEADCVDEMIRLLNQDTVIVGVFADFNNQSWPMPTRAWRFYLRYVLGMEDGTWQGRVVGPLLRFGFNPSPSLPLPIEWLGMGNTLIRRSAYDRVGGFSKFFLHRCTINEDVDLGLKLTSVGKVMFCPTARMSHFHAPGGRVSPLIAAEDDLHNRYLVMRRTQKRSSIEAFGLTLLFFAVETASNLVGYRRGLQSNAFGARLLGRLRALSRIVFTASPAS